MRGWRGGRAGERAGGSQPVRESGMHTRTCRTLRTGSFLAIMNWENVNAFVRTWVEQRGLPADMSGMSLVLVDFQNEADCDFFHPGRDMVSHKAFTMALAKLARERGARTEHSVIHQDHYRAWLVAEKLEDSAENRDAFIESRYKVLPSL